MPNEARRTTLRLRISILEYLAGELTKPSFIISLAYFRLPNLNPNPLFFATTMAALATKRFCNKNDISIPKAPNPIDTKAKPVTNFRLVPATSIAIILFRSETPSNAKRGTKPSEESVKIPMAIQVNLDNPSNDRLFIKKNTTGIVANVSSNSIANTVTRTWDLSVDDLFSIGYSNPNCVSVKIKVTRLNTAV